MDFYSPFYYAKWLSLSQVFAARTAKRTPPRPQISLSKTRNLVTRWSMARAANKWDFGRVRSEFGSSVFSPHFPSQHTSVNFQHQAWKLVESGDNEIPLPIPPLSEEVAWNIFQSLSANNFPCVLHLTAFIGISGCVYGRRA